MNIKTYLEVFEIPEWQEEVAIPRKSQEKGHPLILEKQYGFTTYLKNSEEYLIFVSEKTKPEFLSQLLSFYPAYSKVYRCHPQLIAEKHFYLEQGESLEGNNQVTEYMTKMFEMAIELGATDIHLEEDEFQRKMFFRINKRLTVIHKFQDFPSGLRVKIKLLAGMKISERRRPQDGSMRYFTHQKKKFDIRVSTLPGITQEKLVLRILPGERLLKNLSGLGLSDCVEQQIRDFSNMESGLLLVGGPTSSGKTTLLYSVIKEMISRKLNIISVEDPVEYRLEGITQIPINEKAGVKFSELLRHVLRQDPDVILLGEVRDEETAKFVIQAAQTGHLVLSTIHCDEPIFTLNRLISLGSGIEELYSTLKLVVTQRLYPISCECGASLDCALCFGSGAKGLMPVNGYFKFDRNKFDLHSFREATDNHQIFKGDPNIYFSLEEDFKTKNDQYGFQLH